MLTTYVLGMRNSCLEIPLVARNKSCNIAHDKM